MINNILGDNLKVFISEQLMTQKKFAQHVEIREETVGKIIKRGTLDKNTIDNIVNKYPNLNLNWLFYNKGKMFLEEDKKHIKKYEEVSEEQNIVSENAVIFKKIGSEGIPLSHYVEHLKTEIKVLEHFISIPKPASKQKSFINLLKDEGFEMTTSFEVRNRTNQVHDFTLGDFTITLDGINCILLESGTGIKNETLNATNLKKMIAYVKEKIQK